MDAARLLQFSGMAASVVIGGSTIVNTAFTSSHPSTPTAVSVQAVFLAAFTGIYWYLVRPSASGPRRAAAVLLGVQIFLGLNVGAELLILSATEIPFVVRGRQAFAWLGAMLAIGLALCGVAAWTGDFTVSEMVAGAPRAIGMGLTAAMMLVWTLFAFSSGYLITQLEDSRNATLWARAQLEGSQHLLAETARMGERLRISRELHDTIGHHLTALALNLEVACETSTGAAAKPVQRAQLITRMLLAETWEVLGAIRGDKSLDLKAALDRLCDAMKRPVCRLEVSPDAAIGPAAARALFRCAQEAMTNAARHSRAGNLSLKISRASGMVLFEVCDDGVGTAVVNEGNGLRGMRERFTELGGELRFESFPGRGFRITGSIPDAECAA